MPHCPARARPCRERSLVQQSLDQGAVDALGLEVGEHERECLTHQAAAVDGEAVVAAQREPRVLDIEHARLTMRREHGLAVDRGRLVREALALVLADLEARGADSALVQRLLDE